MHARLDAVGSTRCVLRGVGVEEAGSVDLIGCAPKPDLAGSPQHRSRCAEPLLYINLLVPTTVGKTQENGFLRKCSKPPVCS